MRTPDEIHSMIDYLEQKDKSHPDIAVLRWALKEDQRPVDASTESQIHKLQAIVAQRNDVVSAQSQQIEDLREKLFRFVRPNAAAPQSTAPAVAAETPKTR